MVSFINLAYLVSSVLFILGLKKLSSPKSAPQGNQWAAIAMLIAVVATLLDQGVVSYGWIIIGLIVGGGVGAFMAKTVPMTDMPQMVAIFNGSGGGASLLVAVAAFMEQVQIVEAGGESAGVAWSVALLLSTFIGSITLTGSGVAFAKLQGLISEKAFKLPKHQLIGNVIGGVSALSAIIFVFSPESFGFLLFLVVIGSLLVGVMLVVPIGGADMPVVIALLNSYSGLAAAATGFVFANNGLIISGSLVGASGLILTAIMCKAMNRSLRNVLFGGDMAESSGAPIPGKEFYEGKVKSTDAEEAAMILESASKVIFVPGYGLAVAQAQHVTRELANLLTAKGCEVSYAIHPVAGRMPGHMNVLLAEAEVPYEQLIEMEIINSEFSTADVAIVLGANDVTNPAARDDKNSPIYGMPILDVDKARTVFVVKRSLSPGFAGIPNQLFINENSLMVFGDAKDVLQKMITAFKEL